MSCCFGSQSIENVEPGEVPWFDLDKLKTKVRCIDVYDGDTITIIFSFHKHFYKTKCRLEGIDSAEKRTKNEREKVVALQAMEYLSKEILNKVFWITCGKWDKYGRLLITIGDSWEQSLNKKMVDKGYAYIYDGGKKREFDEWYTSPNGASP